jgi:hypothetical protein
MTVDFRQLLLTCAFGATVMLAGAAPAAAAVMNLKVEGEFQGYFVDPDAVFGDGSETFQRAFVANWQYDTDDVLREPDVVDVDGEVHRTSKVALSSGTITINGVVRALAGGQAYYTKDFVQIDGGGLSLFGLTFYPGQGIELYTDLAQPGERGNGQCVDICNDFTYAGGVHGYVNGFTATTSFAPVPEPATWALLIGGFAGAGAALRRRRAVLA